MDAQVGAEEAAMIEQESGMGSSGGETGNGTSSSEDSSTFWSSSSNSDSSSNDLSGEDDVDGLHCHSEGYNTDTGQHSSHQQPPTTLHWVRMSSLRIHDNASLSYAMANSKTRFRAVFIIDPWFATGERKFGVNRWRFLLECLHDLDKRLKAYNTRLYVAKGHPVAVMEKLCNRWNVKELTFQLDREVRSHIIEEAVEKLAEQLDIKVTKKNGHTLFDTDSLLEKVGNCPITTIKDFKEILRLAGKPDLPVEAPPIPLSSYEECVPEEFQIPTLQELGFSSTETLYSNKGGWIGGETIALKRLVEYCHLRSKPPSDNYVEMLFDKSALSPYIRFGCLSVRYFLFEVKKLANKDAAVEPLLKDLTGKLLQREFYCTVAKQVPNFDCYDNHISFQLPWEKDNHLFSLWKNGRTGYPWIDAAMRQLQKEGWIHLCLRESVASFLTRGDLWISWVRGKDTFEELMLDFEVTVSSGCWMKSSCSAFINGPVEHFCPVTFGKQIDPTGVYVRTFCPELKDYPDEYIYCPWMAPIDVQIAAGCRIGIDYPNPIVDHATAGFLCCEKLRSVMDMVHQGNSSLKSRRPHTNCTNVLQAQFSRFHPYSRLEDGGRARTGESNHLSDHHQQQQQHHQQHHHGNNNSGAPHCTICTSTDNVLTQVLCTTRAQERVSGGNRLRRRSPPLLCSHKRSDFTVII